MQTATHLFTVAEYRHLLDAEVLPASQTYELIEGVIHYMSPIGAAHSFMVTLLTEILNEINQGKYWISPQNPIVLDDNSQPQPDIAVVERSVDFRTTLPRASQVALVIEVAESSQSQDRDVKAPLYARAGIPEYWIVDLPKAVIEQYTDPSVEGYALRRTWRRGETFETTVFPALKLRMSDLMEAE